MIAMLLVSCNQKPIAQKQVSKDFPTLKMEKVFNHITLNGPLLLQGDQYLFMDYKEEADYFHYKALNINTKKILWDVAYPDLRLSNQGSPLLINDLVLCPSTNRDKHSPKSIILALNKDTGSIKWQFHIDDTYGDIVLIQKTLFITSWIRIYALDFQTGKLLWKKSIYDFFPGYSEENDYYHLNAINTNQNNLFVTYAYEKLNNNQGSSEKLGCLAIKPENGSILWKYEKELMEWLIATSYNETLDVIGPYLLVYGYTLLDVHKGNVIWQYKPEKPINDYDGAFHSEPTSFYVGYSSVEQLCFYRICHEVSFEKYGTTLFGVDINTGVTKWKQEAKEKGDSKNSQDLFCVDQNQITNQIFEFILKYTTNEKGYQTEINSMDVYDGQTGKLLQTYKIPTLCWFDDLKSEIRFQEGWWYFIGETSQGDTLFRFQLDVKE
jgi:outer membrane protein assembly factor BamB